MLDFAQGFAVYFIIWWLTLFAVLPIGMRSQAEADDVTLGTVESAPANFRFFKVMAMTTLASGAVYGGWLIASTFFGISLDNLPRIGPDFG